MGDCAANLELCRSTLDDGSLSCAVLLLLLGRWPLVERLVLMANVLYCSFLSTPACNCCINDLHRVAPKRHFKSPPQDPMDGPMVFFPHARVAAETPPQGEL